MQIKPGIAYNSFKYAMYALLLINTGAFFEENSAAEAATFKDGVTIGELIIAYADAIDSFAWLGLLLMFEIETSYHPPERIRKWATPLIGAVTLVFWGFVVYSFFGYVGGLDMLKGFAAYAGADPCGQAGGGALFAVTLDDYVPLDATNCATLAAGALYSADLNMFATPENFSLVKRLLWTDVTNAGAWIIVGALIELEIFMRVTRRATPQFLKIVHRIAAPFWLILVVNVFYWWWLSDVLDAWDAFLWIVAFFFIELNMIAKHEENARRRAAENHA
jgi:hypothetical protein